MLGTIGKAFMQKDAYAHEHEKSSDWFVRNFLKDGNGTSADHLEAHHHKITDESTGTVGEGWGWSYGGAKRRAWEDFRAKRLSVLP